MSFLVAYEIAAATVFSLMICTWMLSLKMKDASVVDRIWGLGFVLIAWVLMANIDHPSMVRIILTSCISIWGLRLSLYIHLRNRGHSEDKRYVAMRREHGEKFWWYSFLSVFSLQGVVMLIVSAPVVFVLSRESSDDFTSFSKIGLMLWFVGFCFEAGGDWQLSRFKSNSANKGKLLTSGLWSLTRHPNYFGDALQWWGIGCFALAYGWPGYCTLIGPAVMTGFIRKISGVDLLERDLKTSKPGYAEYISSTPPFLPGLKFWAVLLLVSILISKAGS